ncbi:MAG: hypothetical protein WAT77_15025 [Paracoccaceae bacterium]
MSRSFFVLSSVLLLTLAGCSEQQMCINKATREVRTLDRLINESEMNLARGYRMEDETVMFHRFVVCGPVGQNGRPYMCFEPEEQTVQRPVPIDPTVEKRTLANMKAKRAALVKPVSASVAECKLVYPEQ